MPLYARSRLQFRPPLAPPFLPGPAPGDHCHLNGLAVRDGKPCYVTALGETTTPGGWRPTRADGGILLDVDSGEVVCRGLSMPHSPRLYDGRSWFLESGTGQLQLVDPATGRRTVVAALPGFARGLAFYDSYAFVGLSRIREGSTFGDLPIRATVDELMCGIGVVDVRSGRVIEFLHFQAGIEEIFAVEVLPGVRFPEILGFQQETIAGTFVLPR